LVDWSSGLFFGKISTILLFAALKLAEERIAAIGKLKARG